MNKTKNNAVNILRGLCLDEIQEANSGHPGIALGAAPIVFTLFTEFLNIDPTNPKMFNRDRFILSAGHASSLLYAMMYLSGFKKPTLDDLKHFRQLNSITAGHPEPNLIPGIEVSSGPLGQGIAMAVGMAIAEKKLANIFNKFSDLVNHYTFCLHGDGCLQEGIAYEAINIAGKLQLNKLILLYDSNNIQLDGKVNDSTSMNVKSFFTSCDWNYIKVNNGNSCSAIAKAITKAKLSIAKPTVIEIKTTIGYGSKLAGSNTCHGSPFNAHEVLEIKKNLGINSEEKFYVPTELTNYISTTIKKRATTFNIKTNKNINLLEKKDIHLYQRFMNAINNKFNIDLKWFKDFNVKPNEATRSVVGNLVNIIAKNTPNLLIGSADLSASTKIGGKQLGNFDAKNLDGQNINYGVREFAMAGIVNGICAHGGIKAIGSTFLVFSDYAKPAMRLAAISHIPTIYVYSHDSITVGEDGPTHQPIEQINTLRMIDNHYTFRPCNSYESIAALSFALKQNNSPVSIITSRGDFIHPESTDYSLINRGAYLISSKPKAKISLWATGSEVTLALEVQRILATYKIYANVISAPCMELFNTQDESYRKQLLKLPIFSIEYGNTFYWYQYSKYPFGINSFGASGKPNDVVKKFKLDANTIANQIKIILKIK